MIEQGAHTIAMYYGAPYRLESSSTPGWCHRHRRPLFGLALFLTLSFLYCETAYGQVEVGGVRISAMAYPQGSESFYVMVEYMGPEPFTMEPGSALILSARTIVHLSAEAATRLASRCEETVCVFAQRAMFPVTREDLESLSKSSTSAIILVTTERTIMGRLDFAHLAPIRRFVETLKPRRAT